MARNACGSGQEFRVRRATTADSYTTSDIELRVIPLATHWPGTIINTLTCAACGYDLRATTTGTCPECGAQV